MSQVPTVLIRVPGPTRDRLERLRQKKGSYSWSPLEPLGAVVERLAAAAEAVAPVPAGAVTRHPRRTPRKGDPHGSHSLA